MIFSADGVVEREQPSSAALVLSAVDDSEKAVPVGSVRGDSIEAGNLQVRDIFCLFDLFFFLIFHRIYPYIFLRKNSFHFLLYIYRF